MSGFRVPGHTLRAGGHALERTHGRGRDAVWVRSASRVGPGVCSCGATSGELRTDSARKRWHQDHKLGLAEGIEPSRSWATGDVVVHSTSGSFAVLGARKASNDGWWVDGGGGSQVVTRCKIFLAMIFRNFSTDKIRIAINPKWQQALE